METYQGQNSDTPVRGQLPHRLLPHSNRRNYCFQNELDGYTKVEESRELKAKTSF